MDSDLTTSVATAGAFATAATTTDTAAIAPASVPAPAWLELFDPQTRRVPGQHAAAGSKAREPQLLLCNRPERAVRLQMQRRILHYIWARPASRIAARDPNGEWWELADEETGVPYYYNSTTGATEWDPPPDATIVPFHALLTSSVGKRLSLVVSNRGSVAFTTEQADSLSRKASRASMHSTDGRISRKSSLARGAVASCAPGAADERYPPPAVVGWPVSAAKASPIAEAQSRLESGTRDPSLAGASNSSKQDRTSAQRHSQSETALETLKEAEAAGEEAQGAGVPKAGHTGQAGGNEEEEEDLSDERHDHFDETGLGTGMMGHHADYNVPASATVEYFRSSEQAIRSRSDAAGRSGGRMSAMDFLPRPGTMNSVMMHSQRNRSMPSIRADSRMYGMRTFASTQFAAQKRGFLRRKVPLEEMVSYTSEPLARPLLNLPREMMRDSARCFHVIQRFMGNSDEDVSLEDRFGDVLWLANTGIRTQLMRDEAFCQLAKQVTGNPSPLAAERGWALMGVLLYAFHPSQVLLPHLEAFVDSAPASLTVLQRFVRLQLARACRTGSRSTSMSTGELRLILTVPSRPLVFGASLDELMATPELVNSRSGLPHILECLVARIVELGGDHTEGLFRVSADSDAVAMTRLRIEAGNMDLSHIRDPNVPASLLKEWLRDLAEPLVPESLYERCVCAPNDPDTALGVLALIPPTALHVLKYLLHFLARLLHPDVQARTRMDGSNLALIFGPTLLRNPASDLKDAFMTTSGEQAFVLTLLEAFRPL
ncbi:hypothetical protein H4R20_002418 [Coemansia guatemalensis]|uniref:RhoGAP-domain-containing protein n=1 Tax=Coemansia guatemalensis TaxID=2761395 RepID=A0A9W8LUP7_9FUNG|nr:hypothetical protein H4R20_002418 [Coemansia guatemalensis]